MRSTKKELKRLRYTFLNEIVDTRALKDFKQSIEVLGKKVGPFKAGNHYRMEFWVAKTFLINDILQLTEKDKLDVQKIQKIAYKESRSRKIEKIDENLFLAIHEYLDVLNERVKRNLTKERKFKDVYSNVQDLVIVRQRKVGNLSQTKHTIRKIQNLAASEKVLIEHLSGTFEGWGQFFLEDIKEKNKR